MWKPISSYLSSARRVGPFTEHAFMHHREKKWTRLGRIDLQTGRWYYSGTSERSQWSMVEGDEPTHWMPIPTEYEE